MVKPRENRIPIMMSDQELKAIDDWRFESRIATRSEAVRRLCRIALILEPLIIEVKEAAKTELDANIAILKEVRPFQSEINQADTLQNDVKKRINDISELLVRSLEANSYSKITLAAEVMEALKSGETLEQGIAEAESKLSLDTELDAIFGIKK